MDGSTHACKSEQCGGGVGRNIAEALWRMRGGRVKLLTAIGADADGEYLKNIAPGLVLDGGIVRDEKTSIYAAIFDSKGECLLGLGEMNIHEHITTQLVGKHLKYLQEAPLVILDGNVPQDTTNYVLKLCHQYKKPDLYFTINVCGSRSIRSITLKEIEGGKPRRDGIIFMKDYKDKKRTPSRILSHYKNWK